MTVHFICRGNALRSLIAEAYLRSFKLPGVNVLSSGTSAQEFKASNTGTFDRTRRLLQGHGLGEFMKDHYADQLTQARLAGTDLAVCMNQIVYDECTALVHLPAQTVVWDISDIGEEGRIPTTPAELSRYSETVYEEITKAVDQLVDHELSPARQLEPDV